jgi:hypothetical protein
LERSLVARRLYPPFPYPSPPSLSPLLCLSSSAHTATYTGPKSNPAHLPIVPHPPRPAGITIYTLFAQLFRAAIASSTSPIPVRFLSRYDKSACNIKESSIWTELGQVPWAEPASDWYHIFPSFPMQALEEAGRKGEYTLTDRGTWFSLPTVREGMEVFVSAFLILPWGKVGLTLRNRWKVVILKKMRCC